MNSTMIDRVTKKPGHWEVLVHPETTEQPLILVRENTEKDGFGAVFALELAGIGRRIINQKEKSFEDEKRKAQQEQYKRMMLSGLSSGQTLDFEYTGGRRGSGKTFFGWTIKGRTQGESADDAAGSARRLWQNLNVISGTLKHEYAFAPVKDEERLRDKSGLAEHAGIIKRVGVAVKAVSSNPMGFLRHTETQSSGSVIVVPESSQSLSGIFDSLALGAAGCASPVTLRLSISLVRLTEKDLRSVGNTVKWLRNGEAKQIRFHEGIHEGSDDKDALANLEKSLECWIANPIGFRVRCIATSRDPIPLSFLRMVGSDFFPGPFTTETRSQGEDICEDISLLDHRLGLTLDAKREGDVVQDADGVLDLQECINSYASLPPLFPQVETLRRCNVKRSFAHVETELQENGIILGKISESGDAKPVRFTKSDRSRHAYVIGATGTGKSTLLYNMIKQDIENGEGVCLIDPHGDLFEQVLRAVPKERAEDVVIVDPSDFDRAVGINFLETGDFNKSVQQNFVVNEMIKIFDRLYDLRTTGGPIFEQYMRNTMLLLMDNEYADATLTDVSRVFEDREFRRFLKKGCKNEAVVSFWEEQAERAGGDASLSNVAPYITSKLNQFVNNALLRPIIGQPRSTINFREIMDSGKILLVNLSKGMLGELDTQLLGMLIIGKLFSSAMGRVTVPQEKRKTTYLYIDEFQNFTTDSVAYLLSEARKFGLALTLANQNLAQLRINKGGHSIIDSVLGNVGSVFMLRLGMLDADELQVYTKPELDNWDLQNQPDFHVAARMLNRNAPSKPFVFMTKPATSTVNPDLASKIKVLSRLKFANSTDIVESEIKQRRTAYRKTMKSNDEE